MIIMKIQKVKDIKKSVKKYYDKSTEEEWDRLFVNPYHKLEWDTTQIFLKKYLPKKGLILDAGAGPGRYSIDLAKKGYNMVILDIAKENINLAKEKVKIKKQENKIKEFVLGTIVNLSKFKNNSFDAVICLGGPLSHVKEKNRKIAINELIRVAKKNAPIFISVMGRYAILLNAIKYWPSEIRNSAHFNKIYINGDDFNWGYKKQGFGTYCHFFTVEELNNLWPKNKIEILDVVGLEGLTSTQKKEYNKIKDKIILKNWLKAHKKLCTTRIIADISTHILTIMKKK